MSSIMTNSAAITALQTLKSTNKQLDTVQGRISTGFRVAEASDNAAYWSIATTMRSDNKALSTVQDSLGLGAATVDVAYTAMDSAKDYLDEIKTKLVAATAPGVDKTKIQSEISELQSQLSNLATSASFSGTNWLSVDSSATGYNATQSIVGSFTRNADNTISLGKINVDLKGISLFDAGAAGDGLLDAGVGNTSVGALEALNVSGDATVPATAASITSPDFVWTQGTAIDTDDFNITIAVDGTADQVFAIDIPTAATFDLDTIVAGLSGLVGATATNVNGALVITSSTTGTSSTVEIKAVSVSLSGTPATARTSTTGIVVAAEVAGEATVAATAAVATTSAAFATAMTFDDNDSIAFSIAVDGGTATEVTINKATVDAALTSTDGAVADSADWLSVINQALTDAGVTGVTATVGAGADLDKFIFTSGTTGATSNVTISGVAADVGGNTFSIGSVDISNSSTAEIEDYINGVNKMIEGVTSAASKLGAVKSRIDMQGDFVSNLMKAIDRGVGQLVDANMEEESTRLQALQVQQQLGIQALSIANSNSQSILSLFR